MAGEGLVRELVRRGGENTLVEHLAALLRVPILADRFVADVLRLEATATSWQVETQVHDPATKARPDIVMSSSAITVWIEAKLDAALTDKQPGIYLEALRSKRPSEGHLVVVAKSSRWSELAKGLRARVGQPPGFARTFVHDGVPVTQITWREVRDCFHGQPLEDPVADYLRSEFVDTIDHHVERITVPYTSEMITVLNDAQVLRALAALEDVLLDLQEGLEADGFRTRHQEAGDLRQTGFYAGPDEDEDRMVWVGMIARAGVAWPGRGLVWAWLVGDAFEDEARLRAAGFEVIDPGAHLPDWADCALVPLEVGGARSEEAVETLRRQLARLWASTRG